MKGLIISILNKISNNNFETSLQDIHKLVYSDTSNEYNKFITENIFKNSIKQTIFWIILTVFCFYVAGEEISWAERLTSFGLDSIKGINVQGETNIHNLKGLNNYLHFSFISTGILFGWIGWKVWPDIEALPGKKFSLFFLIVAAFYTYFDLSWITLGSRIRNDQEVIEFLMSSGLFMHCFESLKKLLSEKTLKSNS